MKTVVENDGGWCNFCGCWNGHAHPDCEAALAQAAREQLDALARGDWEAADAAGRRVLPPAEPAP